MAPPLRLHILGRPRVTDETEEDIGFPAGKPLATLAYIVLDTTSVTREDLARLLWPTSAPDRARASVRQAIWMLRRGLTPDVITESDDGSLTVDASVLGTDLDLLEEAIRCTEFVSVMRLWNGGPFRGFVLPDAPAWNRWASEMHAHWESKVGRFLEARANGLPADERLPWIQHALEVRPYRVELHEQRVRTLLELGRLEEAERALTEAMDHLSGDSGETLLAVEAELVSAMQQRYRPESDVPFAVAFVGRSSEFAELSDAMREVERGRSRRVAIVGPPGIGKTRLVHEFLGLPRAGGANVVEIRTTAAERGLAYGIVAALARQLLRLPGAAGISNASAEALRTIVPSSGRGSIGPSAPTSDAAIGDALVDLFDAVAEESALVLFVDDLHWIDAESSMLLHRAFRLMSRRSVLLLETCRTVSGDRSVLRSLQRDADAGQLTLLTLAPLTTEDVAQLLVEVASVPSEKDAAEAGTALHRASQGYPLHLLELLRALQGRGALERSGGTWVLHPDRMSLALEVPSGLHELISRRLAGISADARTVAGALSDAEGGMTLQVLRGASQLSGTRFDQALSELFAADLVDWADGRRIDFSHELLRESIRATMPARRRFRPWVWAVAAALVLTAGVLGHGWFVGAGADPFNGTELRLEYGDAAYFYEPRSDGSWQRTDSLVAPPAVSDVFRPHFRGPDDRTMIGQLRPLDRGPDIVAVDPDGSMDVLLDGGGDDGPSDLSPDGRSLLVVVEDRHAPQYRLDLEVLDLESGDRRTLLSPEFRANSVWSPDGRAIMAGVLTPVGRDRVLLLRPDGSEADRFDLPAGHLLDIRACGESRSLIWIQEPGSLSQWVLLDWRGHGLTPLPSVLSRDPSLACSPDGSFFLTLDAGAGTVRAVSMADPDDVRTMPIHPAPPPDPGEVTLRWTDVAVPSVVDGYGPDSVAWGGQAPLHAEVWDRGGRPAEGSVAWASLDAEILNVRGDTVVGNRPGIGRAVVTVDGWLKDTVTVVVTGEVVDELLLAEDFDEFPGDKWDIEGQPAPIRVETPDGPGLSAGGDAVWSDGVRSRVAFPVDQGLTAEVQFSLQLTDRRDRQSIQVCLISDDRTVDSLGVKPATRETRLCALYPQGELNTFDAAAVALRADADLVLGFPVSGLGSGDWVSLGVQVRPDGRFSAIANGREVGVFPEGVGLRPGQQFSLGIFGRAEDTELLLRSATVWRGARY